MHDLYVRVCIHTRALFFSFLPILQFCLTLILFLLHRLSPLFLSLSISYSALIQQQQQQQQQAPQLLLLLAGGDGGQSSCTTPTTIHSFISSSFSPPLMLICRERCALERAHTHTHRAPKVLEQTHAHMQQTCRESPFLAWLTQRLIIINFSQQLITHSHFKNVTLILIYKNHFLLSSQTKHKLNVGV